MDNSNWLSMRLGDVCSKIGSGATPRGGAASYLDQGPYALVRSQNVYNHGFEREGLAFIDEDQAKALESVQLREGDVLLNITGESVGRSCQVPPSILPARVNQHVAIVRAEPTVLDPLFLRYALISPETQQELAGLSAAGATRRALTKAMIESLVIRAPKSLEMQRRIANALGALDDKIELNRRMSENLLEITRTAFKAWFVEFSAGPAKGQGLRELSNGRVLPESWDLMPLANFADVVYGAPFASKEFNPPGVGRPLIRIRDLRSMECSAWTTEVHRNGHLIHPGDIVVGMDGEFRSYIWLGSPAWLNQRVCHFEPLPGVPRGYVFCALEPELDFLERSKTGTTVIHLGKRDIDSLHFVWPGAAVLRDFGDLVEPILDRMVVAATEAKTLKSIRDALLPKLISGKLRVPEAEQLVSEVA